MLLAFVLLSFVLVACAGKDEVPTFAAVRDEILVPTCAFSSCHGSGAGGLDIEAGMSADALVDVASTALPDETLVIPGDADGSYLIHKLEGAAGIDGDPMPPGGSLDQDSIDRVRAWIDGGALSE